MANRLIFQWPLNLKPMIELSSISTHGLNIQIFLDSVSSLLDSSADYDRIYIFDAKNRHIYIS